VCVAGFIYRDAGLLHHDALYYLICAMLNALGFVSDVLSFLCIRKLQVSMRATIQACQLQSHLQLHWSLTSLSRFGAWSRILGWLLVIQAATFAFLIPFLDFDLHPDLSMMCCAVVLGAAATLLAGLSEPPTPFPSLKVSTLESSNWLGLRQEVCNLFRLEVLGSRAAHHEELLANRGLRLEEQLFSQAIIFFINHNGQFDLVSIALAALPRTFRTSAIVCCSQRITSGISQAFRDCFIVVEGRYTCVNIQLAGQCLTALSHLLENRGGSLRQLFDGESLMPLIAIMAHNHSADMAAFPAIIALDDVAVTYRILQQELGKQEQSHGSTESRTNEYEDHQNYGQTTPLTSRLLSLLSMQRPAYLRATSRTREDLLSLLSKISGPKHKESTLYQEGTVAFAQLLDAMPPFEKDAVDISPSRHAQVCALHALSAALQDCRFDTPLLSQILSTLLDTAVSLSPISSGTPPNGLSPADDSRPGSFQYGLLLSSTGALDIMLLMLGTGFFSAKVLKALRGTCGDHIPISASALFCKQLRSPAKESLSDLLILLRCLARNSMWAKALVDSQALEVMIKRLQSDAIAMNQRHLYFRTLTRLAYTLSTDLKDNASLFRLRHIGEDQLDFLSRYFGEADVLDQHHAQQWVEILDILSRLKVGPAPGRHSHIQEAARLVLRRIQPGFGQETASGTRTSPLRRLQEFCE
jgi:hypothetical protein